MLRSAFVSLALLSVSGCGGANSANVQAPGGSRNESDPGFRDFAAAHGIETLNGGGAEKVAAEGLSLERLDPSKPIKLDGVVTEWPAMAKAGEVIDGPRPAATTMAIALQYDDAKLYIGAEVGDASFSAGRDHVLVALAVPEAGGSFTTYEIALFAGKLGESEGSVRYRGKGAVPGARIVEAPTATGYDLEATIPWGALPEAKTTRVGIHGVARYVHADTVIATGPGDAQHPTTMGWIPSEPELSMREQLLMPKGLSKIAPSAEAIADLTGDGTRERIAVFGPYLTICGASYLDGTGFFFRDLGGDIVKLEVRDVTGRGKEDVIVRRRANVGDASREYLEVLSAFGSRDEPQVTFAHEIVVRRGDHQVDNAVRIGRGEIEVTTDPVTHWDPASYAEPIATDVAPILLPWGGVRKETWRWSKVRFAKTKEVFQKEQVIPGAPIAHAGGGSGDSFPEHPPEPSTPTVTRGGDLSGELLEAYRKDRGVPANVAPKADLQVQVAGDETPERVLLVGRDIVVFGPGFKGGSGYAYTTLAQFADAKDIRDMSARDLTGDGNADIIVRGELRLPSPKGEARSDVMLVYSLENETLVRVFAIETGREKAAKHVRGLVQFVPAKDGKSFDILSAPGAASGWTERTYPWARAEPGTSDMEPVLLPWGGIRQVRYGWNGSHFTKSE